MRQLGILLLAGAAAVTLACAEEPEPGIDDEMPAAGEQAPMEEQVPVEEDMEEERDTRELMNDATETIEEMRGDAELWNLAQEARAIFLVPDFGRAAAVAGVRAGEGVLLVRQDDGWSDPVFYDVGAISVGAQLGASGGEIAMLLMSEEAVDSFRQEDNFSLSADAGFSLVDYSEWEQARADGGDVIVWSDTEGLFGGVALSVSDIHFDHDENPAYYGQEVGPAEILDGQVSAPEGNQLGEALSR